MREFAALYAALDASTSTRAKLEALQAYLARAAPADAAWAVYLLAGGKPRQAVPTARLRALALALSGLPAWLFEACYQAVGDLAETLAHVLPPPRGEDRTPLSAWMVERLRPLRGAPPEVQDAALRQAFDTLPPAERFLLVKLIGGGLRVGVSRLLVLRALAAHSGLPEPLLAQRFIGYTDADACPDAAAYQALLAPESAGRPAPGTPYPFFLAQALEPVGAGGRLPDAADLAARLGPAEAWFAEWKYDGIRAQLVRRDGGEDGPAWLWSRGEELVGESFPEVMARAAALPPGTVLDGELLVWPGAPAGRPAPFAVLQTRLQRKTVGRRQLAEAPVVFVAYDLLESEGEDRRAEPQARRRARLEALLGPEGAAAGLFPLAPRLEGGWAGWATARDGARAAGVEGLMLKHRDTAYGLGRRKPEPGGGGWWKWKVEPFVADAVLVHAQAGHGRRAGLYTDYGFAVWNRAPRDAAEVEAVCAAIAARQPPRRAAEGEAAPLQLVPFAKAYGGLSDAEFKRVDRLIRADTVERFGPVRSVVPRLVVELGFEGLAPSPRHRSGLAVRFPRMLRLREDKPLAEADTLDRLRALMAGAPPAAPEAAEPASAPGPGGAW